MSRSSKHFDEFKPHSKHKHLILGHYFAAWGHKLALREGAGNLILYVDACAGRGIDELGNHGSPLIAAEAAASAESNVAGRRSAPFRIHVVAIESGREHHKILSALLARFGDSVRALRGTLDGHIDNLGQEFASVPTLYFIDPFGLKPLQAAVVRRALAGDRHEALLLFADQAALRHFGAIDADETRAERRHRDATDELSLFPDDAKHRLAELATAAARSREGLELTRENAIQILNDAFGDPNWLRIIDATPQHERRSTFLRLYSERLRAWGATHVLQIPIVDETDTRAYTLIHASKSAKAYTTMKEAVTYALGNSPLPADVVEHMKHLVRAGLEAMAHEVRHRFASQQVRWAEDPSDHFAPCVKTFVLEETGAFPFELQALQERLKRFRMPGKAIVYSFPEAPSDVD